MELNFEEEVCNSSRPYWVTNADGIEQLVQVKFLGPYKNSILEMLSYMVAQTPSKKIMFFTRFQGEEQEIICGVLSSSEFVKLLEQHKVLFNVCYIVGQ